MEKIIFRAYVPIFVYSNKQNKIIRSKNYDV